MKLDTVESILADMSIIAERCRDLFRASGEAHEQAVAASLQAILVALGSAVATGDYVTLVELRDAATAYNERGLAKLNEGDA
jgi:hypothetical protein